MRVQKAKAEWVRLAERADRLSGKARREVERQANEAFEAYVHSSDDARTCPKIPQGYGTNPADCACGNCPEAR